MRAWVLVPVVAVLMHCLAAADAAGFNDHQPASVGLSPAERKIIAGEIAKLRHPEERRLAQAWSDAKKVAEELCRPAAAVVLRKHVAGADRFFLGSESADSLRLESSRRLTGSGTVRSPSGWRNFTFECRLNPRTGRATYFQVFGVTPTAS